jgi:hypothetical protein
MAGKRGARRLTPGITRPHTTAKPHKFSMRGTLIRVGCMPLLGAIFPRAHLSPGGVCFQDRFMQSINGIYYFTIFINLH